MESSAIFYGQERPAGDLSSYDFETLEHVLREAGFMEVKRRPFRPDWDSRDREVGSLYVDAVKPI